MTSVTREEMYLYVLGGGTVTLPSPVTRKELYLAKACGEAVTVPTPVTREEMYLYKLSGGTITLPVPVTRLEMLMAAACGEAVTPYDPVTREEWFWYQLSNGTTTITGVPPITFTSDGTALTAYSVTGNLSQTGTPTPAQPIVPEEVGDKTENVLPSPAASTKTSDGATITCDGNGRYTASRSGGTSDTDILFDIAATVMPSNSNAYLALFNSETVPCRIIFYNGSTEVDYFGLSPTNRATKISVTLAGKTINKIGLRFTANDVSEFTFSPMIVDSETAPTTFEPYGYALPLSCAGTTYPLYLSEPIRKIGDYADSVDSSGVVTRRIRKMVLDGTESWTLDTSGVRSFKTTVSSAAQTGTNALSSHFDGVTVTGTTLTIPDTDSDFADAAALNTFLASADAAVWYVLATAVTETVTCPTITPASGSNTLSCGTTLAPSSVSITGHIS